MSDLYREILVKRKKTPVMSILKVLLIVVTAFSAVAGIMFFWPLLIAAVLAGVGTYFVSGRVDQEYEYLYVNGDFDIDVIYNKQKRKKAASYDAENLVIFAPQRSHELDSWKNKSGLNVRDFTSGEENRRVWAGVYNGDKGEEMVLLEIDDESLLKDLRRIAPRKVFQD